MLTRHWNNASARERLLLVTMVLLVCSAFLFALLIRPAWRVVRDAPAKLQALDAKVLAMRAQAAQMRGGPVTVRATATPSISAERDLGGVGASVNEARDKTGSTTTITLKGVDGARFSAWLAKPEVLKSLQRLSITRDPASGHISGTVLLIVTN